MAKGILSNHEFELFKKYMKGKPIDSEDEIFFWDGEKRFGTWGLDWTIRETEGESIRIGYTTELGKEWYRRDRTYRNPILNFFYTFFALLE